MDILLKEEDLNKMQPELRQLLVEFLSNQLSSYQETKDILEPKNNIHKETYADISHIFPHIIPIEAACAVVDGLSEKSIEVLSAALFGRKTMFQHFDEQNDNIVEMVKMERVTRDELAQILGNHAAINGTVGSINRRFSHRFDKTLLPNNTRLAGLIRVLSKEYAPQDGILEYEEITPNVDIFRFGDMLPFGIAIWIKEHGLSLSNGDVVISSTNPNIKHSDIILNSSAYLEFASGKGCIQSSYGSELKKTWMDYELNVMCCGRPTHSIVRNSILKISGADTTDLKKQTKSLEISYEPTNFEPDEHGQVWQGLVRKYFDIKPLFQILPGTKIGETSQ